MTEVEIKKILNGIEAEQASLPTRYLYDNLGGILFEAITELPQYNATRDELDIFREKLDRIAERIDCAENKTVGRNCECLSLVVNLCMHKFGLSFLMCVLSAHFTLAQTLVINEISSENFSNSLDEDGDSSDWFEIYNYGDSDVQLENWGVSDNLEESFKWVFPEVEIEADGILVGVDLIKSPEVLLDAYNDSLGVTAAFNRNALLHLNRDLGTNFNVDLWGHQAIYNDKQSRTEMHLVSLKDQIIESSHGEIAFKKDQTKRH